ncbi:hypothetical protein D3C72_656950 [compost metagenome]
MKWKSICTIFTLMLAITASAQQRPKINIKFSRLYATYEFAKKLSDHYPDNEYKKLVASSPDHAAYAKLVQQLDSLNIYYAFEFPDYAPGQKTSVATTTILERNMIYSNSIEAFKQASFGIIPATELLQFADIIAKLEPVYTKLVYEPNKDKFDRKLADLDQFVQQTDLGKYFAQGLRFYNTPWDFSIPIDIVVVPSIEDGGFTGKAFFNNAVTEVPLNFNQNEVLFSVLMHEIYHTLYNEESLAFKKEIKQYFDNNPSVNSQYAYLLLNEVLATALGNGYVYEQITGKPDQDEWYNVKYISEMAKKIYPVVFAYAASGQPMNQAFVNGYIAMYDQFFPNWNTELPHLFMYRYVLTDEEQDFDFFRKKYRYASAYEYQTGITATNLERMRETALTKVIIISRDHKAQLNLVRNAFPELKEHKFNAGKEFKHTIWLADRTKLIIINKKTHTTEELLQS